MLLDVESITVAYKLLEVGCLLQNQQYMVDTVFLSTVIKPRSNKM